MGSYYHLLLIVFISGCGASLIRDGPQQREKREAVAEVRDVSEKITATGGGIVRKGSNVTLSLYVGALWDRCRWFRYDHAKADSKDDFDYCSFDLDEDTNTSSLHKCNNKELKTMLIPLSDDPYSCKIMFVNMSSDMEGKWAARLDTEMDEKEIQLVMEADVQSIELDVKEESVIAGNNVTVLCKAIGGTPNPELTFMLMNADNSSQNTSIERFTDIKEVPTEEENSVTYQARFVPEIEDQGKRLCCKAVQKDKKNTILYETNKVFDNPLDVKFPPQPIKPDGLTQLEAKNGEAATLSLIVKSNPAPEEAVWSLVRTQGCGEDDISNATSSAVLHTCTIQISPGETKDKYTASIISSEEGESHLDLQISSVDAIDYATNYTVTVKNSAGQQNYSFHLTQTLPSTTVTSTIQKGSEGSTSGQSTEKDVEGGASPGVVVILVIFVLMGIISGIVFYKKRQSDDIEQTPLTNTH
jgi:hypothetical protein